jgi:hypothetical protein
MILISIVNASDSYGLFKISVVRERIMIYSVGELLQDTCQIVLVFVNSHMYKKSVEQEMEL